MGQRLHPASIVLGVNLRQAVQALLFPLLAGVAAGGRAIFVILAVVGIFSLTYRAVAWHRFAYGFDGEVLRVEEGVLSRSHRSLDVARVQQVEIDRGAVARLFGLAALRVETAGSSSEVEVELRVIPLTEAEQLRDDIRRGKSATLRGQGAQTRSASGRQPAVGGSSDPDLASAGDPGDPAAGSEVDDVLALPGDERRLILTVPLGHVVLAAVTGAKLLVFPAVIGVGLQFLGEFIGSTIDRAVELTEQVVATGGELAGFGWQVAVIGGLAALVLSVVTAAVVGVLRDARFQVERVAEDLVITRGLLSTRSSVVPLRRVQLVEVQRNWMRRLLGFSAVRIHSAGGSGDADRRVTVPLLRDDEVDALLSEVLPGVAGVPTLQRHPRAALRRHLFGWFREWLVLLLLVLAATRFLPFDVPGAVSWAAYGALPVFLGLAVVEYRYLAHGLTDRVIAARSGALSLTTAIAPVVKVQASSTRQNLWQRRLGLIGVVAHVAGPGGDVLVVDTGTETGVALHAQLTAHAAEPTALALPSAGADQR